MITKRPGQQRRMVFVIDNFTLQPCE